MDTCVHSCPSPFCLSKFVFSVDTFSKFHFFYRCRKVTKKDMILNNYLPKLTGVLGCFLFHNRRLYRGYYMAAWRYEISLIRVLKNISPVSAVNE